MSPPEIWGPAVWHLFHTLAEKVNANAYPHIAKQLFNLIVRICRFLPCPECSTDASKFLAKIKIENLKSKDDFKQTFYLFHNYVNAKKRKTLFNFSNLLVYQRYMLIPVVNNFISRYNTKGNMKLLSESFQRQFVLKDFKNWFSANIRAFVHVINPLPPVVSSNNEEPVVIEEEQTVSNEKEDPLVVEEEQPVVSNEKEEPLVVEEEQPVVSNEKEEPLVVEVEEEPIVVEVEEEPIVVEVEEEPIVVEDEQKVVSNEKEDPLVVEVEEPIVVEEEQVFSTKSTNKKKKNKKN